VNSEVSRQFKANLTSIPSDHATLRYKTRREGKGREGNGLTLTWLPLWWTTPSSRLKQCHKTTPHNTCKLPKMLPQSLRFHNMWLPACKQARWDTSLVNPFNSNLIATDDSSTSSTLKHYDHVPKELHMPFSTPNTLTAHPSASRPHPAPPNQIDPPILSIAITDTTMWSKLQNLPTGSWQNLSAATSAFLKITIPWHHIT
jgi:hypothetical protein